MKIIYYVLTAVMLLAVSSCKSLQDKGEGKGKVTLAGKIMFDESRLEEISVGEDGSLEISGSKYRISRKIAIENGEFSISLDIKTPSFWNITYKEIVTRKLYLAPGYNLEVVMDSTFFDEGFKLSGKGAKENDILESISQYLADFDPIDNSPNEQIKYIDSFYAGCEAYLGVITSNGGLDEAFVEVLQKSVLYEGLAYKILVGLSNGISEAGFYSFLDNVEKENAKYLEIPEYRMFLNYYLDLRISLSNGVGIGDIPSSEYWEYSFNEIEKITDLKVKEQLAYSSIKNILDESGVEVYEKFKPIHSKLISDTIYLASIKEIVEKKMLLAPGKPAPAFSCEDNTGKMVTLESLKGKYVYIDFWATWCGPCKKEIPYLQKLINEYKGRNIAFVSISLDEEIEEWKEFMQESAHSGSVSLIAGNASDVPENYQIQGIPLFVLIDPDGNFVTSNAPRPSSGEIREIFNELLK